MVSPVYGANALGGVINIVSKNPADQPYLEITNGFSSHDTREHILNYAAKSNNASFWFSTSHRESEGFRLSRKFKPQRNESGGLRENSYYEKQAFSLKLGWVREERHQPSLIFNYIDNEKGIPAHVSNTKPRYWRFTEWKRWMVALADQLKISDELSIKGRVFYDKYDNTLKQYDDATYTTQSNPSSEVSISELININTADQPTLETLSGIGPVIASRIISFREENGPFSDIVEIQKVSGIGPAIFD